MSAFNAGDLGSIPGWGRSPGEGNYPLQYSRLENMDGEAWWATVHGVTKSQTRLSDFTYFCIFKCFFISFEATVPLLRGYSKKMIENSGKKYRENIFTCITINY